MIEPSASFRMAGPPQIPFLPKSHQSPDRPNVQEAAAFAPRYLSIMLGPVALALCPDMRETVWPLGMAWGGLMPSLFSPLTVVLGLLDRKSYVNLGQS